MKLSRFHRNAPAIVPGFSFCNRMYFTRLEQLLLGFVHTRIVDCSRGVLEDNGILRMEVPKVYGKLRDM
jgi:hypothetical protein